ncbi:glycosyltransferase family 9 protein [Mucilaginibacter calamicampi]|uniref:Glycosyltransferase family 9 protein n=1 Tax=Mucilaginibacter calamicampi TaxID=1302352 RepID=A0ABW2YWC8_9SPHI
MQKLESVLIYRLGSLGDTIAALPVFNKVVAAFPGADITLLTNKPVAAKAAAVESVLGNEYFFNHILNYPVGTRNPFLLFKLLIDIRKRKPNIVCYLASVRSDGDIRKAKLTLLRDKLFFKAAGVKTFIGFPEIIEDIQLSIDPQTGDFEWEPKRLARRFASIGQIDLNSEDAWKLHFTSAELAIADKVIADYSINTPFIAISTGTKHPTNNWEQHNWVELLNLLGRELKGWHLVVFGAADEAEEADICLAAWGQQGVNLCGKTAPRTSAVLMQRASVFLGHDSGPMHLAASVGTPCVCVFSARHFPRQWYPRGLNNKIIYHRTDCAGCQKEICITQQKRCILSISPYEVYSAVAEVLKFNIN